MTFDSARRRLARASELLDGLASEVSGLEAGQEMVERVRDDATGYYRWIARLADNRMEDIGLHFGEVIHGLHASLDHIMFEILGEPADRIPAFPLRRDSAAFDEFVFSQLSEVPTKKVVAIHDAQPFVDEGSPLPLLRKLDEVDKHRRLVVSALLPRGNQTTVTLTKSWTFNWTVITGPVHDGEELGSTSIAELPAPIEEMGVTFPMRVVLADPVIYEVLPPGEYLLPVEWGRHCAGRIAILVDELDREDT